MSNIIETDSYLVKEDFVQKRRTLIVKNTWDQSIVTVLKEQNIHTLRLSESAGWSDQDLSFVPELTFLKGLEIYSWKVTDLAPVYPLTQIEYLGIQCDAKSHDFTKYRLLKSCFLRWINGAESLFECPLLEKLNIDLFPYSNLQILENLTHLQTLSLASKKLENLTGLENLGNLECLDLYNCPRLDSLSGLEYAKKLQTLNLTACKKVNNISSLSGLRALRELLIEDCRKIETLEPIRGNSTLNGLHLIGDTTVVDGNMQIILSLPKLKTLRLANRRHYKPKAMEVKQRVQDKKVNAL